MIEAVLKQMQGSNAYDKKSWGQTQIYRVFPKSWITLIKGANIRQVFRLLRNLSCKG